ncbi:MAG: aspartate aminotransferase family protein [Candidatus Bathyarchaeia archaeon]
MNESEIMRIEDSFLAQVYQKFAVCVTSGRGAVLYDVNGREYIDCMGGYGVSIVGHCHPKVVKAINEQSERLLSCHGSFYNDKRAELLEKLVKIVPEGLNSVFLSNSGAESVECALKIAAKYTGRKEVVSMVRGYHGKTLGALSATWNPKYRESFKGFVCSNFKFVPFGKTDKIEEAISDETAAVIVEPIQGESGVYLAPDGFLKDLREICDKNGVVLIFDEVQTGFGRTGKMWACQHWDVTPDVMCVAKAMAAGIPIGATIAKEDIMKSLGVGEHSSTFGGNPVACAGASAVIDVILGESLVERARQLGGFFRKALLEIQDRHKIVREVRGLGLMIGLQSRFDVYNILMKGLERGIILLYSGRNVIRFLPPLVISKAQLSEVADTLEDILAEEEEKI